MTGRWGCREQERSRSIQDLAEVGLLGTPVDSLRAPARDARTPALRRSRPRVCVGTHTHTQMHALRAPPFCYRSATLDLLMGEA